MSQDKDRTAGHLRDITVSLNPGGWMTRQNIAVHLGITVRTVTRRVKAGIIQRTDGANGPLYRLAPIRDSGTSAGQANVPQNIEGQVRDTAGQVRDIGQHQAIDTLIERLTQSERRRGQLESKLAGAEEALADAELVWRLLQAELVQARADVARAHLLLRRHAQSSEPIT